MQVAAGLAILASGLLIMVCRSMIVAAGRVIVAAGLAILAAGLAILARGHAIVVAGLAIMASGLAIMAHGLAIVAEMCAELAEMFMIPAPSLRQRSAERVYNRRATMPRASGRSALDAGCVAFRRKWYNCIPVNGSIKARKAQLTALPRKPGLLHGPTLNAGVTYRTPDPHNGEGRQYHMP